MHANGEQSSCLAYAIHATSGTSPLKESEYSASQLTTSCVTCTHRHTYIHMHTYTYTCTHTYVHGHVCIHMQHTYTHNCAHTHTHTHTHRLHTHTHLLTLLLPSFRRPRSSLCRGRSPPWPYGGFHPGGPRPAWPPPLSATAAAVR